MNIKMYAIYDESISEYLTPFFAQSDKHAISTVKSSLSKDSTLVLYSGSFSLWCLGDFDTEEGLLSQGSMSEVCSIVKILPSALYNYVLDGSIKTS